MLLCSGILCLVQVQQAVVSHILHEAQAGGLNTGSDGYQLLNDIFAVAILINHLLNAPDLPLNTGQTIDDLVFHLWICGLDHFVFTFQTTGLININLLSEIRQVAERPTIDELRERLERRQATSPSVTPAQAVRAERDRR